MENLLFSLNEEIKFTLLHYYNDSYGIVFQNHDVFFWDEKRKKVGINYNVRSTANIGDIRDGEIYEVGIYMNYGIASVLGFQPNAEFIIYGSGERSTSFSYTTLNGKCGVEYMYVYTDIIQPSNFGNQMVNILDCFTLDNGPNKGIHNTIYKPLKNPYIDQISVRISDQNGRDINFKEGTTVTCVLHVRPK